MCAHLIRQAPSEVILDSVANTALGLAEEH